MSKSFTAKKAANTIEIPVLPRKAAAKTVSPKEEKAETIKAANKIIAKKETKGEAVIRQQREYETKEAYAKAAAKKAIDKTAAAAKMVKAATKPKAEVIKQQPSKVKPDPVLTDKKPPSDERPADALPAVYRDGTHSAIVFEITAREVTMIPMATLAVERMRRAEFDKDYAAYTIYPVRRAAEVYLAAGQYREIPTQARELLQGIVGDQSTVYKPFVSQPATKESDMATAKNHPNRRATDKPEAATAKKTAAPAPAAKKAAAKEEAPKPTKKAPWEGKKAPEAAAPAAKTAGKKAAEPAAPKKGGGRSKIDETAKFKIGDTSSVKRGFIAEYVGKAQETFKAKAFTRLDVEELFGGREKDAKMGTYFPYCVEKGVFVPV